MITAPSCDRPTIRNASFRCHLVQEDRVWLADDLDGIACDHGLWAVEFLRARFDAPVGLFRFRPGGVAAVQA
jgi:hypothetical protein